VTTPLDVNIWLDEVFAALELDQFFLIGHSMGGWISLQYSLQSERIKKLVLLAPVISFCPLHWKFPFKLLPAMLLKSPYFIRQLYHWMFAKQNTPNQILYVAGYKYGKIQLRVPPTVFEEKDFKKLQPETLVLIGENEVIYSSIKKALQNAVVSPKITAQLVSGSSHCLPAEQPDVVNRLVLAFLGKC
jgi:pimeloyl-ACP methyl ester carboxylesterase